MVNVQRAIFQLYSGREQCLRIDQWAKQKLNATGLETRKGDG